MAKVFIPFSLQELTGGLRELEIPGSNVREIIDQLERLYPGAREQFVEGNHLRLNITVAVDGEISPMGLLEEVGEDSEVHFVAAIRGGSRPRLGAGQ
jgi:molybdopterin converting factor small subunit